MLRGGLAGLGMTKLVAGTVNQALKHPLGLSCQRTSPQNTRVRGLYGYARGREVGLLALCGGGLSFGMSIISHETSSERVRGVTL